jgi:hypothetical protein
MADSANTRTLSRRSALIGAYAGIAAASILGVAAGAALAGFPDGGDDAELVDMCRRWLRLHRVYLHTSRRALDAEELAADAMRKKPAALLGPFEVWPGEIEQPIGHGLIDRGWTRSQLLQYADAKIWRSAYAVPGHSPGDETLLPVPEQARAHARQLLQQLDAWEAERDRLRVPYERLDTACESLSDKLTEVADRIAVRPARLWSGLVAKAGVINAAINEETGALEDGHCALMIVPSLLEDILRLTGPDYLNTCLTEKQRAHQATAQDRH